MKPSITESEFATLVKRAGLSLTDAQRAQLFEGYGHLEAMVKRVHQPRDRAAEPAHVFVFDRAALGEGSK